MERITSPKRSDPPRENRLYPELFALHGEVQALAADTDNLRRLFDIQKRLLRAVVDAEEEVRSAKTAGDDPTEWQYVRYNILCLGDALAFLYIDRFALKQTYFNVDNMNPKQSGGFISGKTGFSSELAALTEAIDHGVPAVLCDLTNVVRYGDICLLGDNDPVLLEVKSSNTKDRRGRRQRRKLQTLVDFFNADRAEGLRGLEGTTVRMAFTSPPRAFDDLMRQAVAEAMTDGTAHFEVDGCLTFHVLTDSEPDHDAFFASGTPGKGLVVSVNELKSSMAWGCYYPYALTLSNTEHFAKFVKGEVFIFALLKIDAFEANLAPQGVSLEVEADEHNIQCRINFADLGDGADVNCFIVGEHMMCRMWTDFLYPNWIVANSVRTATVMDKMPELMR